MGDLRGVFRNLCQLPVTPPNPETQGKITAKFLPAQKCLLAGSIQTDINESLLVLTSMPSLQPLLAFTLLLAYFALHSLLAADKLKEWFSQRTGANFRYYRLIYNVLAGVLLIVLLYWMAIWPTKPMFEKNAWTNGAAVVLLATGCWLVVGSLRQYDLGEFTGIRQITQKNATPNHSSLNVSGFNALVRHPLYLGIILSLVGLFLVWSKISALLLLLSVLVYLPFGIHFEEKKLRRQFGQAYLEYEKRVKRLIPWVW